MSDPVVLLSVIGGVVTIVNQTLIRKKLWLGWALGIPNILLLTYVNWQAGAYGYAVLLGPFYLYNAIMGIVEWRRSSHLTPQESPT